MTLKYFVGTTFKAIAIKKTHESISSLFFKPSKSGIDVIGRTTSIVTDSVLLSGVSAYFAFNAVWELLKAVGNFITGYLSESKDNIQESGKNLLGTVIGLIAAIVSPIVNTVDLVGSAVNTIKDCCQNSEEAMQGNYQQNAL